MKFKTIISTTIIASLITSTAFADNIGRQGKLVPIYNSTLSIPYTTALHGTVDYSVMLPQGVSKVVTIKVVENDVKSYGLKDCMVIATVSANVISAEVEFVPQQIKCEYADNGKMRTLEDKLSAKTTTTDNIPIIGTKSATLLNQAEYPYISLDKDTKVSFHLFNSINLS
ncbi:MAG: hypothetical protein O2809_11490 [Proteobacteria bacterium]|nr:hypothetical protein [Pseudomonadota bacterium]